MKVTRKQAIKMLSDAKHNMNFATDETKAERCYKRACNCKSALDPFYCCSRKCETCYLTRDYNLSLRRIAFMKENAMAVAS